ncbi:MAG TPA: ethanolamine ammonia-lyase subunit EutC [Hansschlegelia sp.]
MARDMADGAVPPPIDLWSSMRQATSARIGLGRSGDAMPLKAVLDFQLAHAKARDAVHAPLDFDALEEQLAPYETIRVASLAPDRPTYLRRPDLGRRLDKESAAKLDAAQRGYDIVFVLSDGLSSIGVQMHAAPMLRACMERLGDLKVAPIVIARQARVALSDDVGERLGARLAVSLIGERPGLSVAESLGVYLTYEPRVGRRDSERNCISNVHGLGGLSYDLAAEKLAWLARTALKLQLTGVKLKDDVAAIAPPEIAGEIG